MNPEPKLLTYSAAIARLVQRGYTRKKAPLVLKECPVHPALQRVKAKYLAWWVNSVGE